MRQRFPLKTILSYTWNTALVLMFALSAPAAAEQRYAWHSTQHANQQTLADTIAPPAGYVRNPMPAASWAAWLRGLPMKAPNSPVRLFSGKQKWRQDAHVGVVDIDIGKRDLQQCADAIMRLRAEWLFVQKRRQRIAFNNTKGKPMVFKRKNAASHNAKSYAAFRKYMIRVFAYAGTYSLERELKPKPVAELAVGDVFIKGGFPGHAILVVDVVVQPQTGDKKFMLLQSYMPAQDMHILKNPNDPSGSPWYDVVPGARLVTPEWEFAKEALRTWASGS